MRSILFLSLFLIACCAGCGGGGYSVAGKVTYPDGSPVPRGEVMLSSGSVTAGGHIIGDGTYALSARVPAGTYKVSVRAMAVTSSDSTVDAADAPPAKLLVDPKFNNPETSELTVEVKGATTYNITVTAPQ